MIKLVQKLEGIGWKACKRKLSQFQGPMVLRVGDERVEIGRPKEWETVLPKNFKLLRSDRLPRSVSRFFRARRFDPDICEEFDLGYCQPPGEYADCLIAPVYLRGEVVSFQALNPNKGYYESCAKGRAKYSNKEFLYGVDWVKDSDRVFVVEGITDVWRLGKGNAVGTFGIKYTRTQVSLLWEFFRGKKLRILYDADAGEQAEALGVELGILGFENLKIIKLKEGDPADLDERGVREILRC